MARISEPTSGVNKAMTRYGWYGGGYVEGLYSGVGVFCVLLEWCYMSSSWCVCCERRGCGRVCSF